MVTRLILVAALAVGLGAPVGRAASSACPATRKAITRPAILGSVFPTPPRYVYTTAKRKNGAAIVTGYMKEGMGQAYQDWWSTIAGSGRYHGFPQEGPTHTLIRFKAWKGSEHGQVDVWLTCKNRVGAVITYYEK